jgi:hypothetical protein
MTLEELRERLIRKYVDQPFSFTLYPKYLEVKYLQQSFTVTQTGKLNITKWFGGKNAYGPYVRPSMKQNLTTAPRIVDDLLSMTRHDIMRWKPSV